MRVPALYRTHPAVVMPACACETHGFVSTVKPTLQRSAMRRPDRPASPHKPSGAAMARPMIRCSAAPSTVAGKPLRAISYKQVHVYGGSDA